MGYCIYKHTAPNGKVYIGITSQVPERRWRNGNGYIENEHFSRAISQIGWENFTHEILFEGLAKEEACKKERELIARYKSNDSRFGYNKSEGGEYPTAGYHHTDETKEKMRNAHIGIVYSFEHNEKISKAKKGRPNGREGKLGRDCSQAGILRMVDENTGEVIRTFFGYSEMRRQTGYAQTPVKECVAGIRKRAYGYKWEYSKRGKDNVAI